MTLFIIEKELNYLCFLTNSNNDKNDKNEDYTKSLSNCVQFSDF